ncbi:MAG: murein biosynthesis integral membrane protein MurJ [Succinivibrionaceae bacterium]|nr:murein biosynthesis integral membrane protein MurJ [Succinivibrionaceae bacterium]
MAQGKEGGTARLLRAGAVTSAATFLSRILGMVRDMAIASLLGAGLSADVFFFANRIPNFFRRLFAEGAFSQAFVPVFSKQRREGDAAQLRELLARTVGTLALVVALICALGMVAAPVLTAIFGWGWYQAYLGGGPDAVKFTEASRLLCITFPYLLLVSLTALGSSLLNIYGRFLIPALTPCVLNLTLIGTALAIAPHCDNPNTALAVAMVAGGALQLLFIVPALWRQGLIVRPRLGWRHPGVRRIRELMLPAILGVSAGQVNLIVNTVLASFLATGAISYLYYSDRLLEFPIGMFAVAISTVILPALSRIDARQEAARYRDTLDWGVRLVLLLGLPSMCGMIALREPILRAIFMHGAFTAEHVRCSSLSLLASSVGVCALMMVRVLVQGFAAQQDTRTPVRCSLIAIGANIALNLILILPLGYIGLALSTALAAWVNMLCLLTLLRRRGIYTLSRATVALLLRAAAAAAAMCALLRLISPDLGWWAAQGTLGAALWLGLLILGGALVYFALCLLLGIRPSSLRR